MERKPLSRKEFLDLAGLGLTQLFLTACGISLGSGTENPQESIPLVAGENLSYTSEMDKSYEAEMRWEQFFEVSEFFNIPRENLSHLRVTFKRESTGLTSIVDNPQYVHASVDEKNAGSIVIYAGDILDLVRDVKGTEPATIQDAVFMSIIASHAVFHGYVGIAILRKNVLDSIATEREKPLEYINLLFANQLLWIASIIPADLQIPNDFNEQLGKLKTEYSSFFKAS
jgi:hypothetical protein